jgi:hypothetical protein
MNEELQTRRIAVTFVGPPPVRQIARASGVSDVEVDGRQVRCLVSGSVQPFLEALHGYEVIGLTSSQSLANADEQGEPAHREGLLDKRGGG